MSKWNGAADTATAAAGAACGATAVAETAGEVSRAPEAAGRMASVDEPLETAGGGIGAENMDPTAVVPKNCGAGGARG